MTQLFLEASFVTLASWLSTEESLYNIFHAQYAIKYLSTLLGKSEWVVVSLPPTTQLFVTIEELLSPSSVSTVWALQVIVVLVDVVKGIFLTIDVPSLFTIHK